jgi:hypothetical protein
MASIDLWAIGIAEVGAPDEVDLAPSMVRTLFYASEDKGMFRRSKDSVPGTFGRDLDMALLPQVLDTIQYVQDVGPALSDFFTNKGRVSGSELLHRRFEHPPHYRQQNGTE